MSSVPKDNRLYNYVKRLANKKFKSPTGVYRSSWIVKKYKSLGGKYTSGGHNSDGLKRWYKEKWVNLNSPIKHKKGQYHSCGRKSASTGKYPLCRPSKRISKKTPRTYKEISRKSLEKAKRSKKNYHRISFGGGVTRSQYYAPVKNVF